MRSFHCMAAPGSHGDRGTGRRTGPRVAAAALAAAVSVTVAACGGQVSGASGTAGSGKTGAVLTVGFSVQGPETLDPAKAPQNYAWFEELAYEPLIVQRSDGSLAPGLATSWSYTGTGNETFVLHLRAGVKFSDGSPLTAQDVADDLSYVVKSAGQMSPFFAGDTFTATGPLAVTIKATSPNPDFPQILTQDDVVGDIISAKGLQSPSLLGTQTFGAGPYMLDASATVTGNEYTYVPNPNYYDKAAAHWQKVVVKVITDPQSMLNAMKTGQVEVSNGDPTTIAAAKQAGLAVASTPDLWMGVTLADRGGVMAKPLSDVRVREALNYATDRSAISKALFPGTGAATSQLAPPGGYGYDPSLGSAYPYDVSKAKQLLAAAGYPHGLSLKIVTGDYGGENLMAQALAQQWQQAGVTLQVTDDANANQFYAAAFGAKFPAFMTVFGQIPTWVEGPSLFLPPASYNPFHTASASLASLYQQEALSSGAQQVLIDQQIEEYLVNQAWFVPVVTIGLPYYATSAVTGTTTSAKAPLLELYEVRPAS
ncbi:MAG: ABC transporter substrate-binding protein [Trebonia sp.]